jgi:hypothetical protein
MAARPAAEDLDHFRSVSPVAHVDKVTASLLFLLGAKDRRWALWRFGRVHALPCAAAPHLGLCYTRCISERDHCERVPTDVTIDDPNAPIRCPPCSCNLQLLAPCTCPLTGMLCMLQGAADGCAAVRAGAASQGRKRPRDQDHRIPGRHARTGQTANRV